jgi:hypothetical protein
LPGDNATCSKQTGCDATGASAAFREQAHCRRTGWLAKLARRPRCINIGQPELHCAGRPGKYLCQNFIFHTG